MWSQVTAEYPDFYIVSVYVPNSSAFLKRLDYRVNRWDVALAGFVKGLEAKGKAVIVAGDLNCAHHVRFPGVIIGCWWELRIFLVFNVIRAVIG